MMSLEELMTLIKHGAMEKAIYTRNENAFASEWRNCHQLSPMRMLSTLSAQSKVRF